MGEIIKTLLFSICLLISYSVLSGQKLQNPITESYLKEHLSKESPRLILTPAIEADIKQKLNSDLVIQIYYQSLQKKAEEILKQPLLTRKLEGFRLLFVSRDFLERMGVLGMIYRVDRDPKILQRIDDELRAVCSFSDWNPQHFLDIAEMSLGVALAIDWVGAFLPESTVSLAKTNLIEKALIPSFNEGGTRMFWINSHNNWNAVCHGGMIAAALSVIDVDPALAAKTISRALDKLPNSLKEYAPDGIYPEGPTYWGYGTGYAVVASSLLSSALGSDFGISDSPGFMESAAFRLHATAPSGKFFNFADSGDENNGGGSVLMSWFAAQTGDALYFDKNYFFNPTDAGRFAGIGMVWLSQYKEEKDSALPVSWYGEGTNPVAVFRNVGNDSRRFYAAIKGGKANLSHGNMDAGTFVFDLNGIRWAMDPGNQRYYLLNKIGFNLSGHCQECPRWTLLTKKNQGHNTITINDQPFNVDGQATIVDFKDGSDSEVTIDMTALYDGNVNAVKRRMLKESESSIIIEDRIEVNDSTSLITWGMMTIADVQLSDSGVILSQDDKELDLTVLSPSYASVSIISLDPSPLEIDKQIENFKRIEIRIPSYLIENGKTEIKVRLSEK